METLKQDIAHTIKFNNEYFFVTMNGNIYYYHDTLTKVIENDYKYTMPIYVNLLAALVKNSRNVEDVLKLGLNSNYPSIEICYEQTLQKFLINWINYYVTESQKYDKIPEKKTDDDIIIQFNYGVITDEDIVYTDNAFIITANGLYRMGNAIMETDIPIHPEILAKIKHVVKFTHIPVDTYFNICCETMSYLNYKNT